MLYSICRYGVSESGLLNRISPQIHICGRSYPVGERGRRLEEIEFTEYDGEQQQDNGEQHRQPERGRGHQSGRGAHVRVAEQLRVEGEDEEEVERDAAPDDEVVEPGPVGHLQSTLRTRHHPPVTL